MKKFKFLFIIFFLSLSLSLSISSIAIGNTYSFSSPWWQAVFSNNTITYGSTTTSADSGVASFFVAYGSNGSSINTGTDSTQFIYASRDLNVTSATMFLPMNLRLSGEQVLSIDLYILSGSELDISASFLTNRDYIPTVTVDSLTSGRILNNVYNQYGGITSVDTVASGAYSYHVNVRLAPDTSTIVSSLILDISSSSSIRSFTVGAVGSTDIVVLPDGVESILVSINNYTRLTASRLSTLTSEIRTIQDQLDNINSSIGSGSSSTENYYNTIIEPNEDNAAAITQLESELSQAKEELSEVQQIISSVAVPTAEDLFTAPTIVESDQFISDSLEDPDFQLATQTLFSFPLISQLLLVVGALATISYVLYGKR